MLRLQYPAAQLPDAFVLRPGGLDPPSRFTLFTRVVVTMWRACGWSQPLISMNLNRSPMADAVETVQEVRKCVATSQIVSVNHDGP